MLYYILLNLGWPTYALKESISTYKPKEKVHFYDFLEIYQRILLIIGLHEDASLQCRS